MIKNNRKEESMHKDLGNDIRKILLENNKNILKPIQKKDISGYL